MATNTTSINYIVLFQDYSHVCTCLLLASEGLVCRHFFQVMLRSPNAKFAFNLLKNRWYKKGVDTQKINTLDISFGIMINTESESSVNFMCGNYNNNELNQELEVGNMIKKRQIYGEYAALG